MGMLLEPAATENGLSWRAALQLPGCSLLTILWRPKPSGQGAMGRQFYDPKPLDKSPPNAEVADADSSSAEAIAVAVTWAEIAIVG